MKKKQVIKGVYAVCTAEDGEVNRIITKVLAYVGGKRARKEIRCPSIFRTKEEADVALSALPELERGKHKVFKVNITIEKVGVE